MSATGQSKIIVTIDGPAASGKGTIAYLIARHYGLLNVDSGACYRAIAWLALEHQIAVDDAHAGQIEALLEKYPLSFKPNATGQGPKCYVEVGDKDVTAFLRTEPVGLSASVLGTIAPIRHQITQLQRRIAQNSQHGVVVEGRDTGTVVFPDATIKFFLTASAEIRAQRRHAEYVEQGLSIDYDTVYSDLQERDRRDSERAYSALRIAEDAHMIDASLLTIDQVVDQMKAIIDKALP